MSRRAFFFIKNINKLLLGFLQHSDTIQPSYMFRLTIVYIYDVLFYILK
jgi:hypothetical protein